MRLPLLIALGVLLSGCALPPPLSEGVMFTGGTPLRGRPPFRLPSNVRPVGGAGVALTLYPPSLGPTLAEQQGHEFYYGPNNAYRFSLPAPQFGIGTPERWGIAFAPGAGIVGLSLNGTVRMFDEQFLTLNVTPFPEQGEIILQRRIYHHAGSGLSAGLFYRREMQDDALYYEDRPVGIDVVGARVAFRLDGGWLRVQGHTSLGFAPSYELPVVGVGLMRTF